jgi:hypothetical protein
LEISAAHAATAPDTDARSENGRGRALSGYNMPKVKKAFRAHDTAAEMVAALLHGPVSAAGLTKKTGMGLTTARKYLKAFMASGVIYRSGLEPSISLPGKKRPSRGAELFTLQPSPFAMPNKERK